MNWFQKHNDDAAAAAVVGCIILFLVVLLTGCGGGGSADPTRTTWTEQEVAQVYLETQACVGLTAPAPVVSFEPFDGPFGLFSAPDRVFINTSPVWDIMTRTDEDQALRHEFIHHLLFSVIGVHDHSSPLFQICT